MDSLPFYFSSTLWYFHGNVSFQEVDGPYTGVEGSQLVEHCTLWILQVMSGAPSVKNVGKTFISYSSRFCGSLVWFGLSPIHDRGLYKSFGNGYKLYKTPFTLENTTNAVLMWTFVYQWQ